MMKIMQVTFFFVAVIIIFGGCTPVITEEHHLPGILPGAELTEEQPLLPVGSLSKEDIMYIDWKIPDYPDIILFHEGSAETLDYTEEIYQYLKIKHASIIRKPITHKKADKTGNGRLYIADVGENWYEVYVFDKEK